MSQNKEEDDVGPESIEEAGILEADVGAHFDQQLAGIDPKLKINMDPQAHRDLRPEMMFIREELRQAKWQTLAVRRAALKKLLIRDFLEEDCELKNLGLSYAPPDP
ncbi:uncharacterized protein LOC116768263 [Danaus plexippus]|uniref:Uncharacterized protein n=1 Tax=Danaus plexippus plexippus TaxID=278856 RepID=A0A212FCR1_DANPL|nr:uncharacterized protein LOC116768263 [Danaus plexippus]OWR51503.1 hypothetical protein KGM_215093 [Danaus plexippus plexippus]